jgi:diguanylate cyclase (GGDEF)-like protein
MMEHETLVDGPKGGVWQGMEDLSSPGGTVRVLLIEDNAHDAMLIAEMLRTTWPEGLVLAHASRLADASQELVDHGASCVLLGLPPGAGLEPIEHVSTAAPDVAIVVLSSEAGEQRALGVLRSGAQDHLFKPEIHPSLLRRAIMYAIERKRSEVQLAHQALHDPLTELPNRALFLDRLGVALDRSRRTSASIAVLFLDVDNFKEVNDSLGHAAGDRVLAGLADRLRAMLRPMDTVARFGGDEFTFLFEDLATEREVVLIAERISRTAAAPIELDDGETSVTVSIGIAIVGDPNIPPESVIREADAAMYRAKGLGRSRYELFDEATRARAMERLELEAALRLAIERSELRVHYQPRVALNGIVSVTGFEALVRWQHPERGLLAPNQFLELAEETGLVLLIGEFVLEQALRQLGRWRATNPELTISVNLSPRQLEDASLISTLAGALRGGGTDPRALCLEITESALTSNPDLAARVLEGLKGVGVGLAIDNYGTGLCSLANLKLMPFDTLKIDASFIGDLVQEPDQGPVVGAVVELAHALGLSVVAEGVETDAQLAQLRTLGCDGAQGFLFGRPLSEDDAQSLLNGVLN